MAQVFVIGTVAADLELRISTRKVPYIRFAISERIGYGETGSRQYYQVWAFGSDAEWLARKNVKKGSLLWISGQLRLVDCLEPDGNAGKVLKITFKDGDYVDGESQRKASAGSLPAAESAEAIPPKDGWKSRLNGDREPLPE
ncbi:MAG: single-stranded DNA-binding protein [Dysosmobacter sp.]|nr:single-stranded DNA-binding protein [Dysosmobacter sp.]